MLLKASRNGYHEVIRLLIYNQRLDCYNEKAEDGQTALDLGEYLNI